MGIKIVPNSKQEIADLTLSACREILEAVQFTRVPAARLAEGQLHSPGEQAGARVINVYSSIARWRIASAACSLFCHERNVARAELGKRRRLALDN